MATFLKGMTEFIWNSPFGVQVNATGVMPVIFATTLLSLPQALARYLSALGPVAKALSPTAALYLPVSATHTEKLASLISCYGGLQ